MLSDNQKNALANGMRRVGIDFDYTVLSQIDGQTASDLIQALWRWSPADKEYFLAQCQHLNITK
jgi:hypothetical protein